MIRRHVYQWWSQRGVRESYTRVRDPTSQKKLVWPSTKYIWIFCICESFFIDEPSQQLSDEKVLLPMKYDPLTPKSRHEDHPNTLSTTMSNIDSDDRDDDGVLINVALPVAIGLIGLSVGISLTVDDFRQLARSTTF